MLLFPIILALVSIIAITSPSLSSVLVYDRELVMAGELWRLVTCHVVHFSGSHLFWNLCGLLLPAWYAWRRGYRCLNSLIVTSVFATSGAVFFFEPEMAWYGGLSGVANTLVVFVACREIVKEPSARWWWGLVLVVCCVNTVYEGATARTSLVTVGDMPFFPAILVHAVGAFVGAGAAFVYCSRNRIEQRSR